MTSLELELARILELIEQARAARDALALATLLQRKGVICAALAAPEQSWHEAPEPASGCLLEHEVIALVA
jgi:hypothetical protein